MTSLSDKYRPVTFSGVFGQDVIVRILQNSIRFSRIPQAILLSGLYGSGKTSLARIYARAINCQVSLGGDCCNTCESCKNSLSGSHQGFWELDAASRNGVDDIKELSQIVYQEPIYSKNVVILDEVHQLSKQAQSSFLKLLEEPPKDTIFILVTTDPENLTDTIRSRCMNLKLKVPTTLDMINNVKMVLDTEGVAYTDSFLEDLANNFSGSFRDVHKLLDQLILAFGNNLDSDSLLDCMGLISKDTYRDLAHVFDTGNLSESLRIIDRMFLEGVDLDLVFKRGVPNILRDFLLISSGVLPEKTCSGLEKDRIKENLSLTSGQIKGMLRSWDKVYDKFSGVGTKIAWFVFLTFCFDGEIDGGVSIPMEEQY